MTPDEARNDPRPAEELLPPGEPAPESFDGPPLSYTPASPVKRALAWVGVAYMVILVALSTYFCFTGTVLRGLAALLAVPGLIGLGAVALIARRTTGRPGPAAAWLIAGGCWLLAAALLLPGVAGLMANFT